MPFMTVGVTGRFFVSLSLSLVLSLAIYLSLSLFPSLSISLALLDAWEHLKMTSHSALAPDKHGGVWGKSHSQNAPTIKESTPVLNSPFLQR